MMAEPGELRESTLKTVRAWRVSRPQSSAGAPQQPLLLQPE